MRFGTVFVIEKTAINSRKNLEYFIVAFLCDI